MQHHSTAFRTRLHGLILLICALGILLPIKVANAQIVIRDTEIEQTLRDWSAPVIKAAGMHPDQINFVLIQHPAINAFVAGGPNIFFYTGLLEKAETPQEVIGVIAHELGHIRGGHLVRTRGAINNASYESLIGTVLGIGAAILTGEGGLGTAIVTGSQASAIGRYLSYSRAQESSADQAALKYLEGAGMNPEGLVSFMKKLENEELLPASQQSEYIRTHPLTSNRIEALEEGHKRSAHRYKDYPSIWQEQHNRILAKLKGFISPERVLWDYQDKDQSIAANYARTIALYRQDKVEDALSSIDRLILQEPQNPYFWELKGQMLLDFGRVDPSIEAYRSALKLKPDAPLIRIAYGHALIESQSNQETNLKEAIKQLQRAERDEPRSSRINRLLATAYGRLGDEPRAQLQLAQEALKQGKFAYAIDRAKRAQTKLDENSSDAIRAKDIIHFAEQARTKEKK